MSDTKLTNLEQLNREARKRVKERLSIYSRNQFSDMDMTGIGFDMFLAGASHASQSVPGDIVERLERVDTFPELGFNNDKCDGWKACCSKLRELLSQSSIAAQQKQESAGVFVSCGKRKPELDSYDEPIEYLVRFKGDDPRSGWVDVKFMTAEEIRDCKYSDYWEWLDESAAITAGEGMKEHAVAFGKWLRSLMYVDGDSIRVDSSKVPDSINELGKINSDALYDLWPERNQSPESLPAEGDAVEFTRWVNTLGLSFHSNAVWTVPNGKWFDDHKYFDPTILRYTTEQLYSLFKGRPLTEKRERDDITHFINPLITNDELCDTIQNTCQLLNGIKPDGVQENWWSEWDESVLQSLISALKRLQKYYGNKK